MCKTMEAVAFDRSSPEARGYRPSDLSLRLFDRTTPQADCHLNTFPHQSRA